jgi:hypothetical protein
MLTPFGRRGNTDLHFSHHFSYRRDGLPVLRQQDLGKDLGDYNHHEVINTSLIMNR